MDKMTTERMRREIPGMDDILDVLNKLNPERTKKIEADLERTAEIYNAIMGANLETPEEVLRLHTEGSMLTISQFATAFFEKHAKDWNFSEEKEISVALLLGMCWGYRLCEDDNQRATEKLNAQR